MKDSEKGASVVVEKVTAERWQEAQKFEQNFAEKFFSLRDDWNKWWMRQFDGYRILKGRSFDTVLEAGCGPHTNVRLILPHIQLKKLVFEDPLIQAYLVPRPRKGFLHFLQKPQVSILKGLVDKHQALILSEPLEDLSLPDESVDLCICVNVLDHVQDLPKCMGQMKRVLKCGGTLVIGQDLSNEDDFRRCPESWEDIGHPIKVTDQELNNSLAGFQDRFRKILPREAGRNPKAHYGTFLFIGEKVKGPS